MPNAERTLIALAIVSHVGLLVVGILIWGALVRAVTLLNQYGSDIIQRAVRKQTAEHPRCSIHDKELLPDGACACCELDLAAALGHPPPPRKGCTCYQAPELNPPPCPLHQKEPRP